MFVSSLLDFFISWLSLFTLRLQVVFHFQICVQLIFPMKLLAVQEFDFDVGFFLFLVFDLFFLFLSFFFFHSLSVVSAFVDNFRGKVLYFLDKFVHSMCFFFPF